MFEVLRADTSVSPPTDKAMVAAVNPRAVAEIWLISQLRAAGTGVLAPDMIGRETLDTAVANLVSAPHRSFEADIIGTGEYYLGTKVDGIISAKLVPA